VNKGALIVFVKINSSEEIAKNYINTTFPLKIFIPNEEVIYTYEKVGKSIKLVESK
jgi:hypothetical protein